MKIYLATGNENKKREVSQLFPEHTIVIPKDEGIAFDPEETGSTFYENSLIKAKALWEIVHSPVLADDSGICADALDGAPGIFSSRYAGPEFMRGRPDGKKISQSEQNSFLIQQITDSISAGKSQTRAAHYTCSMVLYMGGDRLFVVQETMEGQIISRAEDARGSGGFGYDPIFYLPELKKTAAELTAAQKNEISHRGKASRLLKKIADEILSAEEKNA
ncbi:RdgB/HAM1 family non-canonical purine NTP pyrophosphatase [Treponema sp.]|uniref:RdgB/HAM1 family non-canonical purine NTP pyrophosphatase n=1 Tax=Treponema sp. TaxID=166 RepID=UPI003F10E5CC